MSSSYMNFFYLILLTISVSIANFQVRATELNDALKNALKSATIKAQKYSTDANKNQIVVNSISRFLPNVSLTFMGKEDILNNNSLQIQLQQQLFNGGRDVITLNQSRKLLTMEDLKLTIFKQEYLTNTVISYMKVLSALEIYKLNSGNEQLLKKHFIALKKRFDAGEITKTDLSRAKARLSLATSETIKANSQIKLAEINYKNIVGELPNNLIIPKNLPQVPTSLEETLSLAKTNNLKLQLAYQAYRVAKQNTIISATQFLPSVNLAVSLKDSVNNPYNPMIALNISVPISQNIITLSEFDRANTLANQKKYELYNVIKSIEESVTFNWEEMSTAKAMLTATKEAISTAKIALENVTQEFNLNLKTSLDVLDSEQELLKAKTDLINAKNTYIISRYKLLFSIGNINVN